MKIQDNIHLVATDYMSNVEHFRICNTGEKDIFLSSTKTFGSPFSNIGRNFMKYLLVAPFEECVPPKKYGGTELVVSKITEELVTGSNKVYLIASGDSTTSANLIPIVEKSLRSMNRDEYVRIKDYQKFAGIAKILQYIDEIKPDVVHNHLGWRLVAFSNFVDCPMISTAHGPVSTTSEQTTYTKFPKANYVSISDNQLKALPDINWVKTVYNSLS